MASPTSPRRAASWHSSEKPYGHEHQGDTAALRGQAGLKSPDRLRGLGSPRGPLPAAVTSTRAPFGVAYDVLPTSQRAGSHTPASDKAPFRTSPRSPTARRDATSPRPRHRRPAGDDAISSSEGSPFVHDTSRPVAARVQPTAPMRRSRAVSSSPKTVRENAAVTTNPAVLQLRSIPLFKGMSDADRLRLVNGCATRPGNGDPVTSRFGAGDQIVQQGAPGDSMFVLLEGRATVEIEFIGKVTSYGPGDTFGELALQSDETGQRSATVTAETDVVALEIGRENFEGIVGKLGENMVHLKRAFHAASYGMGRRDYAALFRHLDKDNSGHLEEAEFRNAVRKEGKTPEKAMPERQLRVLYHIVDVDTDGLISEADFTAWLGVSSPEAYNAQLRQLEAQRDAVIAQAQEVLRSDHSLEAAAALATLMKTKAGLVDEIAAKEEQIRLQRARDIKRVESFRTVAAAAQQATVR